MRRARWPASGHPGTVLEEVHRMVATGGRVMTAGFALRAGGYVPDSRPVCRGRQAGDGPSVRGSGAAGACAQVRDGSRIVCIATVRMWVHYPERENARWLAGIYDHDALRDFIGVRDFNLRAGWYYWDFPVAGEFPGTDSLCLTAQFGTGPHLRAVTSCATPACSSGRAA